MANPLVHEIAAELGLESRVVLEELQRQGNYVKGPSSSVPPPVARKVRESLKRRDPGPIVGFTGRLARALPQYLESLPHSLPSLLERVLVDVNGRTHVDLSVLRAGIQSRVFYFCSTESAARVVDLAKTTSQLRIEELPAPVGVLLLSSGIDVTVVAWSIGQEALSVLGVIVRGGPRAGIYRADPVTAPIDGSGTVKASGPIGLLGAALDSIPSRSAPPPPKLEPTTRALSTESHPQEAVKVVWATRGGGSRRGDGSTKRTSNWLVRGHWRNQWYASVREHRRLWIAEHEAGADDGPRLAHDLVRVIAAQTNLSGT